MKNSKVIMTVATLALISISGAAAYTYINNKPEKKAKPVASQVVPASDNSEQLVALEQQYAAMNGETYDRNFIANMIVHHTGAIDMAQLAKKNAKHPELKETADKIITAQTKEKNQMLAWQKAWGYPPTSAENMQDHSAMGMMDDMATMTAELQGKTGDEFDKAFLSQMIKHHKSAVAMAKSGPKNAQRQEIKDLTQAIVDAQSTEISQMQQWQREWGYVSL